MRTKLFWLLIVLLCVPVALFLVAFVSNLLGRGATTGM